MIALAYILCRSKGWLPCSQLASQIRNQPIRMPLLIFDIRIFVIAAISTHFSLGMVHKSLISSDYQKNAGRHHAAFHDMHLQVPEYIEDTPSRAVSRKCFLSKFLFPVAYHLAALIYRFLKAYYSGSPCCSYQMVDEIMFLRDFATMLFSCLCLAISKFLYWWATWSFAYYQSQSTDTIPYIRFMRLMLPHAFIIAQCHGLLHVLIDMLLILLLCLPMIDFQML